MYPWVTLQRLSVSTGQLHGASLVHQNDVSYQLSLSWYVIVQLIQLVKTFQYDFYGLCPQVVWIGKECFVIFSFPIISTVRRARILLYQG